MGGALKSSMYAPHCQSIRSRLLCHDESSKLLSAPVRVVRESMSCPVTSCSPRKFAVRPLIYRPRKLRKGPTRELEHVTPQIYTYSADDADTPTTTVRSPSRYVTSAERPNWVEEFDS